MPMFYESTVTFTIVDTSFSDATCFTEPSLACLRACYMDNASVIDLNSTRPADSKDFLLGTLAFVSRESASVGSIENCSCPDFTAVSNQEGGLQVASRNAVAVGMTGTTLSVEVEWTAASLLAEQGLTLPSGGPEKYLGLGLSSEGHTCWVFYQLWYGTLFDQTIVLPPSSSSSSYSSSSSSSHSSSSSSSSSSMPMFYESTVTFTIVDTSFSDATCFTEPSLACLRACYMDNASVIDLNSTRPADSKDFLLGTLAFVSRESASVGSIENCSCPDFTAVSNQEGGLQVASRNAVAVGMTGTTLSVEVEWTAASLLAEQGLTLPSGGPEKYLGLGLSSEGHTCWVFYQLWYGTLWGETIPPPSTPAPPSPVPDTTQALATTPAPTPAPACGALAAAGGGCPQRTSCDARLTSSAVSGGEGCVASSSCNRLCLSAGLCATLAVGGGSAVLSPLSDPQGCSCPWATSDNVTSTGEGACSLPGLSPWTLNPRPWTLDTRH